MTHCLYKKRLFKSEKMKYITLYLVVVMLTIQGRSQTNGTSILQDSCEKQLQTGRYQQALLTARQLSEICGASGHCPDSLQFQVAKLLATACLQLNQTDSAEEHIAAMLHYQQRAMPALRGGDTAVVCLLYLAEVHLQRKHYDSAFELLQKAEWAADNTQTEDMVMMLTRLGEVWLTKGAISKAQDYFSKALQTYRSSGLQAEIELAALYNNMAFLHTIIGSFSKANWYFEKAGNLLRPYSVFDPLSYARYCSNRGSFYFQSGLWKEARSILEEGRQWFIKADAASTVENINLLAELGLLAAFNNDAKTASRYLRQADSLRKTATLTTDEEIGLENMIAIPSTMMESPGSVINSIRRLWEKSKKIYPANDFRLLSYPLNIAMYSQINKDYNTASAMYMEAEKVFSNFLAKPAAGISLRDKYNFFYWQIINLESIFQLLHITASLRQSSVSSDACNMLLAHNNLLFEEEYKMLHFHRQHKDSTAANLLRNWQQLEDTLHWMYNNTKNLANPALDSMEMEVDEKNRQLSYYISEYASQEQTQHATVSMLAKRLKKKEALVIYFKYNMAMNFFTGPGIYDPSRIDDYSAAFVIRSGDSTAVFVPLTSEKILVKINRGQNGNNGRLYPLLPTQTNTNKTDTTKLSTADTLANLLWKPLEPYLQGVQTVFTLQDGIIHRIPLGALPLNNKKYVSDVYTIRRLFSAAQLLQPQKKLPQNPMSELWGGIDYASLITSNNNDTIVPSLSGSPQQSNYQRLTKLPVIWDPLAASMKEIDAVQKIFPSKQTLVFRGKQATEAAFLTKNSPRGNIIHLSTHGYNITDTLITLNKMLKQVNFEEYEISHTVKRNPLYNSGLVMAGGNHSWQRRKTPLMDDGIVTAAALSRLNLTKTGLVTMAACETARGDGKQRESAFGLHRGLKLAGVHFILATLWNVPDGPTQKFIVYFYKELAKSGNPVTAFTKAQLLLKKVYKNPYYWAAFVLIE